MAALSQAAKKATRVPYVEPQPEQPRSPTPVVDSAHIDEDILPAGEVAQGHVDSDVKSINAPEEVLEIPPPPKPIARPTRAKTTKNNERPYPVPVPESPPVAPKKKRGRPRKVPIQDPAPKIVDSDTLPASVPLVKPALETEKAKLETRTRLAEVEVEAPAAEVLDVEDAGDDSVEELPPSPPPPTRQTRKIAQELKSNAATEPKRKAQLVETPKPPVIEARVQESMELPKTQTDNDSVKPQTPAAKPHSVSTAPSVPAQLPAAQPLRTRVSVISVESGNTETEEEIDEREVSQAFEAKLIHRPSVHTTHVSTPISLPRRDQRLPGLTGKPKLQPTAGIQPKPQAFTRIIRVAQPSPKSALASPQKRTLPGGGRPSVTFAESLTLRRGSSDISTAREARKKREARDAEREKFMEGTSARTGGVMTQIVEVLDAIQAVCPFRFLLCATLQLLFTDDRVEPWRKSSNDHNGRWQRAHRTYQGRRRRARIVAV